MCLSQNLQLYLRCSHMVKLVFSVYMMVIGIIISTDVTIQQAFGSDMLAMGILVTVLGVLKPCNVATGHYGSAKHNKCALLIVVIFDSAVGIVQFWIGLTLLVRGSPEFDDATRRACGRRAFELSSKCDDYWGHDRTAGMRLAWMSTYYRAVRENESSQAKLLAQISDLGKCCGFGPPESCQLVESTEKFPSHVSTEHFLGKDMVEQRFRCSEDRDCGGGARCWYPEEKGTCEHFADSDISNTRSLGCRYDWGIGSCLDQPVDERSRGCAWTFEETMNEKIWGHGITLVVTVCVEIISVVSSCCFFWKRKRDDILPINYVYDEPWDPVKAGKLQLQKPKDGTLQAEEDGG